MTKRVLLCLHGWGGDKDSFQELRAALDATEIEVITPNLPGFGTESEPEHAYSVDDYSKWVEELLTNQLRQLSIINYQLSIIGHSLGGRIAIKLASRSNITIKHLYLCASAGIERPKHLKRTFGLTCAKAGNAILSIPVLRTLKKPMRKLLYKVLRVHDYEQATPLMQQTLVKITNEDLRPLLSQIKVPTDIFWGEDDQMTPIVDAHIMNEAIKGSSLHTYPNVRHRVHRDKAQEIAQIIQDTLRD